MERKSPKCPPTVEANQFGCVWNFSGMFDHHHHHHNHHGRRKLLSNQSHGSKSLPGSEHARSQVRMLTFDEHLRSINIESKKKAASVNQSIKNDEISNITVEKSFWKKIKSRYESPNKKNKDANFVDRIVVLKPNNRILESPVDVGCHCSYLHHHSISTNKQQIIKHSQVSFNDVRRKLKNAKKAKKSQKTRRPCEASKGGEVDGNDSKPEKLALVPFSKNREPEVFVEARKHLAERLRQVAKGEFEASTSKSKQGSRTLERILLSSPVHESMASFCRETERTRVKSLDFLRDESKVLNMDLCSTSGDTCIEGSRQEFSLDVSSPKVDCKSGNHENDQFRENPSPVSVLESYFIDNTCSPTSTIESVELQIQPHRLDFEEHSSQTSSPPHRKTSLSLSVDDRGFISSYINEIYEASESNWEEFLAMDYPSELSCDHKLLHDCVKEVLINLHSRITFVSSKIRPFSLEKDVVNEVIEQVDWHNGQPMVPRTLDNLVRRDIAKNGQWVDVISDRNDIVFEVVDDTLEVLIMEVIFDIRV